MLFCCVIIKANTQTYSSSCIITPAIEQLYKVDAMRMTIARLNETNHPYKDSIALPQDVYDSVMRVFAIVHNMQNSPLKDTLRNLFMFSNFGSQTLPIYDTNYEVDSSHITLVSCFYIDSSLTHRKRERLNYFEVHIDSTINWAKEWANNNYLAIFFYGLLSKLMRLIKLKKYSK